MKLIEIRCSCGKLLGKVQDGAEHEHKCPRCKRVTLVIFKGDKRERTVQVFGNYS